MTENEIPNIIVFSTETSTQVTFAVENSWPQIIGGIIGAIFSLIIGIPISVIIVIIVLWQKWQKASFDLMTCEACIERNMHDAHLIDADDNTNAA